MRCGSVRQIASASGYTLSFCITGFPKTSGHYIKNDSTQAFSTILYEIPCRRAGDSFAEPACPACDILESASGRCLVERALKAGKASKSAASAATVLGWCAGLTDIPN